MNWRDRAACRPDPASIDATDPEQFYATFKSENQWADALSFCGRCDVTSECLGVRARARDALHCRWHVGRDAREKADA